jgi:hypothetical protein
MGLGTPPPTRRPFEEDPMSMTHARRRHAATGAVAPLLLVIPAWMVLAWIGAVPWSALGAVSIALVVFAAYRYARPGAILPPAT